MVVLTRLCNCFFYTFFFFFNIRNLQIGIHSTRIFPEENLLQQFTATQSIQSFFELWWDFYKGLQPGQLFPSAAVGYTTCVSLLLPGARRSA